jgi:hypothetical protein
MSVSAVSLRPRVCACSRPLLSDDTCLRCGHPPTVWREPRTPEPAPERTWTRAQVIRALEAFVFFRGRLPVARDWTPHMDKWPPLETVLDIFGSVDSANAAAGLERSQPNEAR